MKDESLAHLHDAHQAGLAILAFMAERTFEEYEASELLRSAVERKFEIMGEALARIRRTDPSTLGGIRDHVMPHSEGERLLLAPLGPSTPRQAQRADLSVAQGNALRNWRGGCHEPRRGSSTAMAARVLGYRRGAIP